MPILVGADKFLAPESYDEGAALKWFHEQVQRIARTYSPVVGVVRSAETFFPRQPKFLPLYQRCRVEGVIAEALNSCGIKVEIGPMATISSKLGSAAAKHYLSTVEFRGLDWSKYDNNRREAILAAASALPDK